MDANNNNISPAVCVESLYFETQTGSSNEVYRMSMKNRTLIAGDNLAKNTGVPSITNIPYYTVKRLSSGNNLIYELNIDSYSLEQSFNDSMDIRLEQYYKKDTVDDEFLKRNNGGVIYGSDNKIVLTNEDVSGNTYKDTKSLIINVDKNNDYNIKFGESGSLKMSSSTGLLTVESKEEINFDSEYVTFSADVSIGDSSSWVDVRGDKFEVNTNELILNATEKFDIDSNEDVNISGKNINITADNDINLNGVAWSVKTSTFDSTKYNVLQMGKNEAGNIYMKNDVLPGLYFYNVGNKTIEGDNTTLAEQYMTDEKKRNVYFNKVNYAHMQGVLSGIEMMSNKDDMKSLNIKGIKSGESFESLVDTNTENVDYTVEFVKINGKSLIGAENIILATPDDISTNTTKLSIKEQEGTKTYNVTGWSKDSKGSEHEMDIAYATSVTFTDSGDLIASRFLWNSDERLKTEIGEVEVTDYLPEIKQFYWKDSSIRSFGYIAQELEYYYPELVSEDSNGIKKVDYSAALSLTVACLQKEVHQLYKENAELREMMKKIMEDKKSI